MRWLRAVCLGALLIVVGAGAQQPAHDDITAPGATDAPGASDTEVAEGPVSMVQADTGENNSERTSDESGDAVLVPEGSAQNESHENESTTSGEGTSSGENVGDGSEQDESGDTSAIPEANSNENNSESNQESTENGSPEIEAPVPDPNVSRSTEFTNEVAGDVVETEGGRVQGYYLNGDADLGIHSYYDIPYGTFSSYTAPVKHPGWEGVRQITQHQTRCPQPNEDDDGNMMGQLDCLTLSVFTLNNIENASVLFHIHDGNFETGSGDPSIYGPQHLVTKGVILVLPNYRLNALGFLCKKNSTAPGNAGLKDLTLALKWTKNNIALFGGDPSNIVVSGDGTAGALAGYLAISPMSRDYVKSVIAESGSVLAHWAIDRNPEDTAAALSRNLNGDIDAAPIELLIESAKDIKFKPCIEEGTDAFIDKSPWVLLEEGINKTFMIGAANHAGLNEAMQHSSESLSELNNDFSKFLPNDLKFKNDEEKAEIGDTVKKQYFAEENVQNIEKLSLCYTDAYYLGPTIRAARLLAAAGSRVYFYEFSFLGDLNRVHASLVTTVRGAARGDIVGYVFVQDDDVPQEGTDDAKMVELMTDLWVSFMQSGTPVANNVEWTELKNVEESDEDYLLLDSEPQSRKGLREDLALWTRIYNEHFVDRSSANHFTCCLYLLLLTVLLLLHVQ